MKEGAIRASHLACACSSAPTTKRLSNAVTADGGGACLCVATGSACEMSPHIGKGGWD